VVVLLLLPEEVKDGISSAKDSVVEVECRAVQKERSLVMQFISVILFSMQDKKERELFCALQEKFSFLFILHRKEDSRRL